MSARTAAGRFRLIIIWPRVCRPMPGSFSFRADFCRSTRSTVSSDTGRAATPLGHVRGLFSPERREKNPFRYLRHDTRPTDWGPVWAGLTAVNKLGAWAPPACLISGHSDKERRAAQQLGYPCARCLSDGSPSTSNISGSERRHCPATGSWSHSPGTAVPPSCFIRLRKGSAVASRSSSLSSTWRLSAGALRRMALIRPHRPSRRPSLRPCERPLPKFHIGLQPRCSQNRLKSGDKLRGAGGEGLIIPIRGSGNDRPVSFRKEGGIAFSSMSYDGGKFVKNRCLSRNKTTRS